MQTLVRASSSSLWTKQGGKTLSHSNSQQQHVSRVNNWLIQIISHPSERDFLGGWELVWLNRLLVHVYRSHVLALHTQWYIKWTVINPPISTCVHVPSTFSILATSSTLWIIHEAFQPFCFFFVFTVSMSNESLGSGHGTRLWVQTTYFNIGLNVLQRNSQLPNGEKVLHRM